MTEEQWTDLAEALPFFTNLTNLSLSFTGRKRDTKLFDSIPSIWDLNTLKFWENLGSKFKNNDDVTEIGISKLGKALGNLKKITSIQLSFWNREIISDAALGKLSNAIVNLPSLTALSLDCRHSDNISEEAIIRLCGALPKDLSYINLNFTSNQNVSDKTLRRLHEILPYFEDLNSLKLHFKSNIMVTDEGVTQFVETLLKLLNLDSVYLDLAFHKKVVENASAKISRAGLRLTSTPVELIAKQLNEPEDVISIIEALSELRHLESTELQFSKRKTLDNDWSKLNKALSQFQNLEAIALTFSNRGKYKVTEKGMKKLKQVVSGLEAMKAMEINFKNYRSKNKLPEQEFAKLEEALDDLDNLYIINLSCRCNAPVTTENSKKVAYTLSSIQDMKAIQLEVKSKARSTKNQIGKLLDALLSLKNLSERLGISDKELYYSGSVKFHV